MALSLVTNIASFRAQRNLAKTTNQLTGNIERLSSGLRINRAGDDAARSSISAQIGAQILGIGQAMRNANDAVSLTQTAEGALAQNNDIISRMRELAVQASNEGTMDATERGYLDQEFQLLESELNRIVAVTEFNGTKLIDGSLSAGTSFQVGFRNSSGDRISISINDSDATQLGLNDELLTSATGAQAAISALDTALQTVATARASLGASENRLAMTISSLGAYHENMSATNSRLRDADIAAETAAFTRNQILTSAGTSVLAQANAIPQSALALLG
jgi:flagellin